MILDSHKIRMPPRVLVWWVFLLLTVLVCPSATPAQTKNAALSNRFQEATNLRTQEQYDQAIDILREIIGGEPKSEDVLRRAYTELVFTHLSKGDHAGAEENARDALVRFPDIKVDPRYVPDIVDEMFDGLRTQLFGTYILTTNPDSCRVELDGSFRGISPLLIEYLSSGEHVLTFTKPGYEDLSSRIRIEPGTRTGMHYPLKKKIRPHPLRGSKTGTGIGIGISNLVGDCHGQAQTGRAFGAYGWLAFRGSSSLIIRLAAQGTFFGHKENEYFSHRVKYRSGLTQWRFALTFEATKKFAAVEPYFGTGLGLFNVRTSSRAIDTDQDDYYTPETVERSSWEYGVILVSGLRVYLIERTAVDLSVQYDLVPEASLLFGISPLQTLSIFVNIHFGRT